MTTPQNVLYTINDRVRELTEMLRGKYFDEEDSDWKYHGDIYDKIFEMEKSISSYHEKMSNLENQMNLIIKLLSK
jgi:hypothetical protein